MSHQNLFQKEDIKVVFGNRYLVRTSKLHVCEFDIIKLYCNALNMMRHIFQHFSISDKNTSLISIKIN